MATAAGADAKDFSHPPSPRQYLKWELGSHVIIKVGLAESRVSIEQAEGVTRCVPRAEYL
eukprot:5487065-Pleurochrysis_carterae.AAC.1